MNIIAFILLATSFAQLTCGRFISPCTVPYITDYMEFKLRNLLKMCLGQEAFWGGGEGRGRGRRRSISSKDIRKVKDRIRPMIQGRDTAHMLRATFHDSVGE